MTTKDQKSSVHNEQFDTTKNTVENTEEKETRKAAHSSRNETSAESKPTENKTESKDVKKEPTQPDEPAGEKKVNEGAEKVAKETNMVSDVSQDKKAENMNEPEEKKKDVKQESEDVKEPETGKKQEKIAEEQKDDEVKEQVTEKKETTSEENVSAGQSTDNKTEPDTEEKQKTVTKEIKKEEDKAEEEASSDESETAKQDDNQEETETEKEKEQEIAVAEEQKNTENEETDQTETKNEEPAEKEKIDYSALNPADLVAILKDLINDKSVLELRGDVEAIKTNFYKKQKAEVEKIKRKFLEEEGEMKDFKVEENPLETELKELLKKYKDLKSEYNKTLEDEKQKNLEEKYRIIEEIKDLVNRKESINKTFQEFRELQQQWRSVGLVPQQSLKDLWETYHHHVETFYDYININKELRDLDLKKNLEAKIGLCEKAEELLLEPSVINAFNRLQKLHDLWREIGPVPAEMRTEIWERFKETTSKINKRHQEYFINLKHEQKNNLEAKATLCEKVEEINTIEIHTHKEWEKRSNEIIEIQKVWKTIGFAPKKDNNKIYQRFREACDEFFNKKREFYAHTREEQNNNLQLKTDLCVQAESLQDSTEWQKTTEELISLQKQWKQIGPVPHKYSDKIWKRFRAACDKFFQNKSEHFSEQDSSFSQNLKKKQDLIAEIENFKGEKNVEANFEKLKDFQRRWADIGFVPYKFKDEIQEKYRASINKQFDNLKIDDDQKNLLKFKTKIENLEHKPNTHNRLRHERDKYINKLKQLENDIVLWENNIGFFAKSKNAEAMIKEVKDKIKNAKKNMELLKEKIQIIDEKES